MKPHLPLPAVALLLLFTFMWSGCKRSEPQAPSATAAATATQPGTALVAHAGKMGIAAKIPQNVDFYFGSANLKEHLDALRKSQYWKSVEAFKDDTTPSGDEKNETNPLQDLEVEDLFVAAGTGSGPAWNWLMDLNRIYGEYTYRTLITGFVGGGGSMKPENILANAASSPELIEKICVLLEHAELPPLMFGAKSKQAQELLNTLLSPEGAEKPEWLAALKQGTLPIEGSGSLTTYEGTVGLWLTEAVRADLLKKLAIAIEEQSLLSRVEKTLAALAAKPFMVAVGVSDGYLIAAIGNNLNHVKFAKTPSDSLLALPELETMHPHAGKPALGLMHVKKEVLEALHDDQPLTPMLRSALGGLANIELFSELTGQLDPKVEALMKAEKEFYRYNYTNANGFFWWDGGLRLEIDGVVAPDDQILDKPLAFASLLDTPGALFAMVGHSPASTTGRAYFERWMEFLYVAAGGLIQTGLGGESTVGVYSMIDKSVIPPLVKIYEASRTMYREGLGTESAFVVDLAGEASQLPMVPTAPATPGTAAKPLTIPRFASVNEVANRPILTEAWKTIETQLNQLLAASPAPMPPMAPVSSEKDGLVTWFYPLLAFGGNDLMPCVSVSDKIFMLGTSKNLHETLAARVAKGTVPAQTGTHFVYSFGALRDYLKSLESGNAQVPGLPTEKAATAAPWLEPFGNFRGSRVVKNGRLHHSFHLEAKDVRPQVD
jgi:hypothetical protein